MENSSYKKCVHISRTNTVVSFTMRVVLAVCFLFTLTYNTSAQAPTHELRANLHFPFTEIIDVHYEYYNEGKISVGLSAALSIVDNIDYDKSVSIFSRYYTGQKLGHGFFAEGHIDLLRSNDGNIKTLFVGPSIGYKHYLNGIFHIEAHAGLGARIKGWGGVEFNTIAFPRAGVLIGIKI